MTTEPPEVPDAPEPAESFEPLSEPEPELEPEYKPAPPEALADETEVEPDESPFSSGEGMVALGGAIVAAVFVLFELIADVYDVNTATLIIAVGAAILPRLDRDTVEKVAPLPVLMKLAGYLLLIAGAIEVVMEIRFGVLDEFLTVVGALGAYAGYAIAFLGARSIET